MNVHFVGQADQLPAALPSHPSLPVFSCFSLFVLLHTSVSGVYIFQLAHSKVTHVKPPWTNRTRGAGISPHELEL